MSWEEAVFRKVIRGEGKRPARGVSVDDAPALSWDEAKKSTAGDFGGILHNGLIDISFDDEYMGERFLDMAEANNWLCIALRNPENGHLHTFWKNTDKRITKNSAKDTTLAVGLVADIHGGKTYIPVRASGLDRFPPEYDLEEGEELQEVPEELLPVNTKITLWDLGDGDGRNDALSGMARLLVHHCKPRLKKETIKRILKNTNSFIFHSPMDPKEVDTILRDETFRELDDRKLELTSAADLEGMDIKPVEFIIDGLLPVGLTILASPPKYGKSYMCMDMALSVANGRPFLEFTTHKSGVIYLSLEDRLDRIKQRMKKVSAGTAFPPKFMIGIEAPTLEDDELLDYLDEQLEEHPAKLVIIDTFAKIRGAAKRNESAYATDSREAGALKHFADTHNVAILLVTHTRKGIDPSDPFANITGTYGISGIADNMIVLTREKRDAALTKMSVTGRDVVYEDYPIVFNRELERWIRQGTNYELTAAKLEEQEAGAEYMVSNIRKTVLKLLKDNGGVWKGKASILIEESKINMSPIQEQGRDLSRKLLNFNRCFSEDGIRYTRIKNGNAPKIHRFEKIGKEEAQ